MRLYEIANPNDYSLPDNEEMDIYRAIETCLRVCAHGDSHSRPKKKRGTKKAARPSMISV
jgi:hypothetical protein